MSQTPSLSSNNESSLNKSGETSLFDSFIKFFSFESGTTTPEKQTPPLQRSAAASYDDNWKRPGKPKPAFPGGARAIKVNAAPQQADTIKTESISSTSETPNKSPTPDAFLRGTSTPTDSLRNSAELPSPIPTSTPNSPTRSGEFPVVEDPKIKKFRRLLEAPEGPNLETLRQISWSGIPPQYRAHVWRMLLGYEPVNPIRRESVLERKRDEYRDMLTRHYVDISGTQIFPHWIDAATSAEKGLLHQIRIDVPRTLPHNKLCQHQHVQKSLERILFMWALRHPASSYVQGINDLVIPFYQTFLRDHLTKAAAAKAFEASKVVAAPQQTNSDSNIVNISSMESSLGPNNANAHQSQQQQEPPITSAENASELQQQENAPSLPGAIIADPPSPQREEERQPSTYKRKRTEDADLDPSLLDEKTLFQVEADSYWCVSKFIDSIQDNYTFAQPGLQRMIMKLQDLIYRLDPQLHQHLEQEGAQFIQFSFRWMNCLLMRELPLRVIVRLWDTYLSEGNSFATLHTYVCASLLVHFSSHIVEKDFQGLMIFLQSMPTEDWDNEELDPILAQAFMWMSLYHDAPGHLR